MTTKSTHETITYRLLSVLALSLIVAGAYLNHVMAQDEDSHKYEISLPSRTFIPPADIRTGISEINEYGTERVHVLLQFFEPRRFAEEYALKKVGVILVEPLSTLTFIASIPGDLSELQSALKPVRWVGVLEPQDKISLRVLESGPGLWAWDEKTESYRWRLVFFKDVNYDDALFLAETFGTISSDAGTPETGPNFEIHGTSLEDNAYLLEAASHDIVSRITDGEPEKATQNIGGRIWTNTDIVHEPPKDAQGNPVVDPVTGNGIHIGIWDGGGVFHQHFDFKDKVLLMDCPAESVVVKEDVAFSRPLFV